MSAASLQGRAVERASDGSVGVAGDRDAACMAAGIAEGLPDGVVQEDGAQGVVRGEFEGTVRAGQGHVEVRTGGLISVVEREATTVALRVPGSVGQGHAHRRRDIRCVKDDVGTAAAKLHGTRLGLRSDLVDQGAANGSREQERQGHRASARGRETPTASDGHTEISSWQ